MQTPILHLNGTPRDRLEEQWMAAIEAIYAATTALAQTAPNGRDYYPIDSDAFGIAAVEHNKRMDKLRSVEAELRDLMQETFVGKN